MYLFFVNKGFHSLIGFEPAKLLPSNIRDINANAFATRMKEIQKILQDNMLITQADHECYANQHYGPALQNKIGNMIWLDTRNLFNKRLSKKLENCYKANTKSKRLSATTPSN